MDASAITAAFWSAVAATCSAFAALMAVFIQRRNLLESVRPEIVLTGWRREQRQSDAAGDVIVFSTIKNVGRGAAMHVNAFAPQPEPSDRPAVLTATRRLPILAVNEAVDVNGEVIIWWNNVPTRKDGHKHAFVTIHVYCWDSHGMRHDTRYALFVVEAKRGVGVSDEIAPGVMLHSRTTTTRAVWMLKLQRRLARVVQRWRSKE